MPQGRQASPALPCTSMQPSHCWPSFTDLCTYCSAFACGSSGLTCSAAMAFKLMPPMLSPTTPPAVSFKKRLLLFIISCASDLVCLVLVRVSSAVHAVIGLSALQWLY